MPAIVSLLALILAPSVAMPQMQAPLLAIPHIQAAPTIDGAIAPGEWAQAAATCGFRDTGTGQPVRGSVVVQACYDVRALYCLFECLGEKPDELKGEAVPRDSGIYGGSLVELFIAPADWPLKRYAHLMLNHAGAMADEMCDGGAFDLTWNADWEGASGKAADRWIAEMAIPWSALSVDAPEAGESLRVNFARNAASIPELPTWSPVRGGFHQPEQFGRVVLAGDGPVVRISQLPPRATGPATVQARLSPPTPGASLAVTVATPQPGATQTLSAPFESVAGAHLADAGFTVPNGAVGLRVSARAGGRLLWRQTVSLDLPDVLAQIRQAQAQLAGLQRPAGGPETAGGISQNDLGELRQALAGLEDDARGALDEQGLAQLSQRLESVQRHATDLLSLAAARQHLRPTPSGGQPPPYFVSNPVATRKIQPTSADPGTPPDVLRIAMARGEYEPVQIAVCAVREDLRRVRVSASRLRGPNGSLIPRERVVVTPIGFVDCKLSTGGARLRGQVPDVLLPDRPMDVPAGRRQPFFVTVQSTADDLPGEYRGFVRVRPENAPAMRLPLVVRVYDLLLPLKSHLRTAFVLWGHYRPFFEGMEHDAYIDTYIRYSKLMLAHRITPITMWRGEKGEDGNWDFSDFDRYLSELVPHGLTTVNFGGNGQVAMESNTDFATAAAAHFRERGWWPLHYFYGHDEAAKNLAQSLRDKYGPLVQAVPDIKIMQTGWSPHPELNGFVKIWCPLTAHADLEAIRAAQKANEEVWWYVCCGPNAPYANLFVDYPGIDHRILGWMTYQKGIEGFLYWGVDVWSHNYSRPLHEYDEADYANWDPNSYSTINGDGYLLYPARGGTALPSLRLALLRDGFEDYDLFTEATALARRDGVPARRLRALLRFDDIIPTLTDFTQDGRLLLARREAILRAAEQVAGGGP